MEQPTSEAILVSKGTLALWDQKAPSNKTKRIEELVSVIWLLRGNDEITSLNLSYQPVDLRVALSLQTLLEANHHIKELDLSNSNLGPGWK